MPGTSGQLFEITKDERNTLVSLHIQTEGSRTEPPVHIGAIFQTSADALIKPVEVG